MINQLKSIFYQDKVERSISGLFPLSWYTFFSIKLLLRGRQLIWHGKSKKKKEKRIKF